MTADAKPIAVRIENDTLLVTLADGRIIGTPVEWYDFLINVTVEQRANVQLRHFHIWWEDLQEGLSIEGMLQGVNPKEENPLREETIG